MAHRVILLPRSNWAAFGAKRTLTSAGRAPDLWAHAQVQRVAAPEYTWLASRDLGSSHTGDMVRRPLGRLWRLRHNTEKNANHAPLRQ